MKLSKTYATTLFVFGCALLTTNAIASSSEAWQVHNKDVVASCIKASQLKEVRPAGAVANFTDDVGYAALMLQGRYPQKHMKNKKGRELCLFDKKTQQTYVTDADIMMTAK